MCGAQSHPRRIETCWGSTAAIVVEYKEIEAEDEIYPELFVFMHFALWFGDHRICKDKGTTG
jgi:hypothetical protein